MKLNLDVKMSNLPVSGALIKLLNSHACNSGKLTALADTLIFNFRDKSYDAESGGWHPVEIGIYLLHGQWQFDYITDFSFQGFPYPELVKEVDFNFTTETANFLFMGEASFNNPDVVGFYQMWESNFLAYANMGAFDEIVVTAI